MMFQPNSLLLQFEILLLAFFYIYCLNTVQANESRNGPFEIVSCADRIPDDTAQDNITKASYKP